MHVRVPTAHNKQMVHYKHHIRKNYQPNHHWSCECKDIHIMQMICHKYHIRIKVHFTQHHYCLRLCKQGYFSIFVAVQTFRNYEKFLRLEYRPLPAFERLYVIVNIHMLCQFKSLHKSFVAHFTFVLVVLGNMIH